MLSNKPYLLRAFHQWIVDSHCTPILVLDAHHPHCHFPLDYIEGDEIVFNISSDAIRDLEMTNDGVQFKASFSGVIHLISAHIKAVLAIYAEENGEGIFFDGEDDNLEQEIVPFKGKENLSVIQSAESVLVEQQGYESNVSSVKNKPFLKLVDK